MAYQRIIRWLHLSDFHVGKDYQGQEQLFEYILAEVREKIKEKFVPDLVFITGDIANKGLGSEYRDFTNKFLRPLKAHIESELKSEDRIFLIPGNHDVSRVNDWIVRYDVLQEAPDFFDPSTQGAEHRKHLLDRFKGYTGSAMPGLTPAIKRDWLQADGFYTYTLSIHDYKIGILGLNTAWLSKGDGDRHHMSPGKPLVEKGLQELEGCHIKIVLGHHPIDWFEDDQVKPIRALLGRHNVIYLHGHLHKTGGGREEGGGNSFLPIQAGAAFQAREHEQWVNQILWCELDCDRAYLTVEPLKWSRDNQTWVINTEAFPPPYQKTRSGQKIPGKHWYLSLPFSLGEEVYEDVIDNDIVYSMPRLPEGWLYIDRLFVEKERKRKLEEEQVIRFFDGSYPSWQTILSPTIKPLSMTSILLATLEKARLKAGPGVTVLLGPGGEGKTTVLKQVVCDLVNPNSPWMVIWREDEDCEDAMNFVLELPEIDGKTWLIVADFVNNIIDEIYTTTKSLYKSGRKDIQFLLCCRDTDWNATAGGLSWTTFTMHYEKHLLNGLTDDDARKVVASWKLYGSRGLRKLADISFDEAVNRFIDEARLAAPSKEGSFLGAMLEVRFDHEGLKEHIKHVLERLEQIKIPGGTLLEAFAYIAALHAKEAELVTKETLALKLGCPSDQIKQHIIGPLGKEAALSRSGKYILTRHTKIARAAIDILAEPPFNYDMEERYIINFVRSVVHAYKLNSEPYKDDIRKWRYLSNEIFNLRRRGILIKGNIVELIVKKSEVIRIWLFA